MASPSQLFSCVNAVEILKSPINNSTAKNHWTFSKSPRFANQRVYCDKLYELPTTKTKRHTSFGYGRKTDLDIGKHPHQVTPSPDKYQIGTFVDTNKLHKSGYTVAIGRELTSPRSYIQLEPIKVPGPGTYRDPKFRDTPNWSMRPRTTSQFFPNAMSVTQKIVPGPGGYQHVEATDSVGRYSLSKFRNSQSKTWNPKSSHRFSKSTTDVPGPGTYQPKNDMSKEGSYVLSTNRSDGKRMILLSGRDSFVDDPSRMTQTPGPGNYRLPSDFGIYDHLNGACKHESLHSSMHASAVSKQLSKNEQS